MPKPQSLSKRTEMQSVSSERGLLRNSLHIPLSSIQLQAARKGVQNRSMLQQQRQGRRTRAGNKKYHVSSEKDGLPGFFRDKSGHNFLYVNENMKIQAFCRAYQGISFSEVTRDLPGDALVLKRKYSLEKRSKWQYWNI